MWADEQLVRGVAGAWGGACLGEQVHNTAQGERLSKWGVGHPHATVFHALLHCRDKGDLPLLQQALTGPEALAKMETLPIETLELLAEDLLDFTTPADLDAWLAPH